MAWLTLTSYIFIHFDTSNSNSNSKYTVHFICTYIFQSQYNASCWHLSFPRTACHVQFFFRYVSLFYNKHRQIATNCWCNNVSQVGSFDPNRLFLINNTYKLKKYKINFFFSSVSIIFIS